MATREEERALNLIFEVFGDDVFVQCWDGEWYIEYVSPEEWEARCQDGGQRGE